MQLLDPTSEYLPEGQEEHSWEAKVDENSPLGHVSQGLSPTALNKPTPQLLHSLAPSPAY
jgi:hypothetical protein